MVRNSNSRSKITPAARRRDDRRRSILRAATASFRDRGFAGTGMRDIALAAGLSTANLYYYFRSKQDLLYWCQDQSLRQMLEACRQSRAERSAAARLKKVVEAHALCVLDELGGGSAHLEGLEALSPAARARIAARRDRYEEEVRALIEVGVRRGEFVSCDPALVARAILGALNWTARWWRPGGRSSPTDVAAQYADYLVRGLLVKQNGSSRSARKNTRSRT